MNRSIRIALSAALICAALPGIALARPNYRAAFVKVNEIKPDSNLGKAGCGVCHFGTDKKNRNGLGMLLEKALGKPGASDDEFLAALKTVEGQEVKFKVLDLIKADKTFENSKPAPEVKEEKAARKAGKASKALRARR